MDAWFSAGLGWTWLVVSALLLLLAGLAGLLWWRSLKRSSAPRELRDVDTERGAGGAPPDEAGAENAAKAGDSDDVVAQDVAAVEDAAIATPENRAATPETAREKALPVIEVLGRRPEAAAGVPRARTPPRPTQHPLVLVHGVLGFDRMQVAGIRVDYFRGVIGELRRHGFEVHVVRVNPLAPIPVRAAQLAEQVIALGAGRVNLVAHSMGGLDARYALAHLGLGDRVASLTTIGTPHRGTPVADHGTRWLGDFLGLRRVAARFGADVDGFWQLTTHHMERFNAEVPDVVGVWYASVVSEGRSANPILRMTRSLLARGHGASDGLVPTHSQRWGTVVDCVDADHWAQIGWGMGFDAPKLYVRLGRVLGERGL